MIKPYKPYFPLQKKWIDIGKLSEYVDLSSEDSIDLQEDLRLSDLMKHSGISNFTKKWKNERNKLKGNETNLVKLAKMSVSKQKGYVTFFFITEPTYVDKATIVNPKNNFKPMTNPKSYTMLIRILDFFKLAQTTPGYQSAKELSLNDLKEILQVASIQIFCDCMSFHFQGDNFNASLFGASVFPTSIPPKYWKKFHHDQNIICKHLTGLLAGIKYWLNPMTSTLNKYLKNMK